MNKTVWKIFICFTVLSAIISMILLIINCFGIAYIGSDTSNVYPNSQRRVLERISKSISITDNEITLTDKSIIPENKWCILIDESGNVVWEQNKPEDIPNHYTINDIAKMTRWYLNDYPVYVRAEDYGLFVLGIPKNSVGKYDLQYSMDWFDTLPQRILIILAINLILAVLLAFLFGFKLYKRMKTLTLGIKDLRLEKRVQLKEKGIFKELSKNINETSESIERKNAALLLRDNARSNWIAGISHDIRTPLSMIMGYSETLANDSEISDENKQKANIITAQSIKMKKLIEDLNLISSLEYDMQPSKKKRVRLCPLLRSVVTEIVNNGLSEKYEINLDFGYEPAVIMGDETLLERAFFNLLNNSITHNEDGCKINISEYVQNGTVYIKICDNGIGVPDEVIENIAIIPKTAHGLGLPMAYKVFYVHGGKMKAENNKGFSVRIELPISS